MDCLLCRYFRPSESEIEIISERKKRIKNNKNEANYNNYSTNNNVTNTDDEIKTSKNHIFNRSYEKQINDLNIKNSQKQQIINQYNQKINDLTLKISQYEQMLNQKNNIINQLNNKIKELNDKLKNPPPQPPIPPRPPTDPIIRGLNNIGATCYMNATLQCLSNTKKLTEYFKKYANKRNNTMSNEYHKLLLNLYDKSKNNTPYSPYSFKEVLSKENNLFEGVNANDSKDLINFLLEKFHQELNEVNIKNSSNSTIINQQIQTNEQMMLNLFLQEFKEKYNSPISNFFYGVMETKSQCHGCKIIKFNFQVYSFIEFPLQEVNKYYFNKGIRPLFRNDGKNPDVDLYECFEYYGKVDLMNGDNQMYCNICKRNCDAFYSTLIYSAPRYLIVNLNRGKGAVYECKVNFPEQLNLFNFISYKGGITVFELYAVICHWGPSSMSGHFVAYCRNIDNNKWYFYNDGIVTKCNRDYQYQDGMPYILFYRALTSS